MEKGQNNNTNRSLLWFALGLMGGALLAFVAGKRIRSVKEAWENEETENLEVNSGTTANPDDERPV